MAGKKKKKLDSLTMLEILRMSATFSNMEGRRLRNLYGLNLTALTILYWCSRKRAYASTGQALNVLESSHAKAIESLIMMGLIDVYSEGKEAYVLTKKGAKLRKKVFADYADLVELIKMESKGKLRNFDFRRTSSVFDWLVGTRHLQKEREEQQ